MYLLVFALNEYPFFFIDEINNQNAEILNKDLNFFSLFIKQFSEEMPFFYGFFSIMFAIFLGVCAAFIRRFISKVRKKFQLKVKQ